MARFEAKRKECEKTGRYIFQEESQQISQRRFATIRGSALTDARVITKCERALASPFGNKGCRGSRKAATPQAAVAAGLRSISVA